ncbi:MAG: bifunctional molybdenum cofactor biosynthesis protein MoaC/MoaB [candidate division KSB1 bacterium]|nr:bifunctional molybdenum cofactor biosynthesis protein MoaC/MoaB [candidate division KSB1 bacterium]
MLNVADKPFSLRYAKARGRLSAKKETLRLLREGALPKGDPLPVARDAAILAAKRTADWIVMCHPIPLDWIGVDFTVREDCIEVSAEVQTVWKTGVEMEALTAVSAALLNLYDMLKTVDDQLRILEIELVEKRGGKSDFRDELARPLRAAVVVVSDSTFRGERHDRSGKTIRDFLESEGIQVVSFDVVPDERERIAGRLRELSDRAGVDLIITTGGTGVGPRDVTPEATREVIEKEVPGIAEAIRRHGRDRTPYAMLSREVCGIRGQTLIVNLPGSTKGVKESLQALFPGLLHAFAMMWGGGHQEHGP